VKTQKAFLGFQFIKVKFAYNNCNESKQENMKKATLLFGVIAIFIILSSTDSFSQDWPQWRGINRDGKITGFKVPSKWPAELVQQWKITVGTGDATPALV
jgi:hypothetical protein